MAPGWFWMEQQMGGSTLADIDRRDSFVMEDLRVVKICVSTK